MLSVISQWLGTSPLHDFMINVGPAFPIAETLHFIGLSLLFGSLLLVDLRGMGFLRQFPLQQVHRLVPLALLGFAINAITGVLFIAFDPATYLENTAFQIKLGLIALAGLNALLFEFAIYRPYLAGNAALERGALIRLSSAASLLLWCGVLVFGRLIPFL